MRHRIQRWSLAVMLLLMLIFSSGCATYFLTEAASVRREPRDHFRPVEKAYKTTDGQILICGTGTLATGGQETRFTLRVDTKEISKRFVEDRTVEEAEAVNQSRILLPRSSLKRGWPKDSEVTRKNFVNVPISPTLLNYSNAETRKKLDETLQKTEIRGDTVFNFQFAGGGCTFLYVVFDERKNRHLGIWLDLTRIKSQPYAGLYLLLPLSVALDIVFFPISIPGYALIKVYGRGH